MLFENYLRRAAYRLVNHRDGYRGVTSHKKDFHRFATENIEIMTAGSIRNLRRILSHASKTSPYYRSLFKEIDFDPANIKNFEDIKSLPYLTKDIIEKNKQRMTCEVLSKNKLEMSHTGGSSGTPTSFFRDKRCTAARIGRQLGILERCGYNIGDRCGLIWGVHEDLLPSQTSLDLKRRFRKFASGKETLCCTIMDDENMEEYYQSLVRFKPTIIYGYPNAIAQFANFIQESGLPPIRVKKVFSTAERLTEIQRMTMTKVFGGEVFNLYCTREHGCIGFECQRHDGFHLDIGSLYLEILCNGRSAKPGETGEIVVTDLLNYGMPFIRYKIGDRGRLSSTPCECGCALPLLCNFDGRISDMLYRPDGAMVAGVMLIDMFSDQPAIKRMQIVQEHLNEVDLLLVPSKKFNEDTKHEAIREMKKYLGNEVNINVKLVREIPRNPLSGKYQEVVCKITSPSTPLSP